MGPGGYPLCFFFLTLRPVFVSSTFTSTQRKLHRIPKKSENPMEFLTLHRKSDIFSLVEVSSIDVDGQLRDQFAKEKVTSITTAQRCCVHPEIPTALLLTTETGFAQLVDLSDSSFKLFRLVVMSDSGGDELSQQGRAGEQRGRSKTGEVTVTMSHQGATSSPVSRPSIRHHPVVGGFRCIDVDPASLHTRLHQLCCVFSLCTGPTLYYANFSTGEVHELRAFVSRVMCIAADGDHIVAADGTGDVAAWRSCHPEVLPLWAGRVFTGGSASSGPSRLAGSVQRLFLLRSSTFLGLAFADGTVRLYDVGHGVTSAPLGVFPGEPAAVLQCLSTATGMLATLNDRATLTLWTRDVSSAAHPTAAGLPPMSSPGVAPPSSTWSVANMAFLNGQPFAQNAAASVSSAAVIDAHRRITCAHLANPITVLGCDDGHVMIFAWSSPIRGPTLPLGFEAVVGEAVQPRLLAAFDLEAAVVGCMAASDDHIVIVTKGGDVWRWPLAAVVPSEAAIHSKDAAPVEREHLSAEDTHAADSTRRRPTGPSHQAVDPSDFDTDAGVGGGDRRPGSGEEDVIVVMQADADEAPLRAPRSPEAKEADPTPSANVPQPTPSAPRSTDGQGVSESGGSSVHGQFDRHRSDDDPVPRPNGAVPSMSPRQQSIATEEASREPRRSPRSLPQVAFATLPSVATSGDSQHLHSTYDDAEGTDAFDRRVRGGLAPPRANTLDAETSAALLVTAAPAVKGLKAGRRMDPKVALAFLDRAERMRQAVMQHDATATFGGTSPEASTSATVESLTGQRPQLPVGLNSSILLTQERERLRQLASAGAVEGGAGGRDPQGKRPVSPDGSRHSQVASRAMSAGRHDASSPSAVPGAEDNGGLSFDEFKARNPHLEAAAAFRHPVPAAPPSYQPDEIVFNCVAVSPREGGERRALDRTARLAAASGTHHEATSATTLPGVTTTTTTTVLRQRDTNAGGGLVDELLPATALTFQRKPDPRFERERAVPAPRIEDHLCGSLLAPSLGAAVLFTSRRPKVPLPEPLVRPFPPVPVPASF